MYSLSDASGDEIDYCGIVLWDFSGLKYLNRAHRKLFPGLPQVL